MKSGHYATMPSDGIYVQGARPVAAPASKRGTFSNLYPRCDYIGDRSWRVRRNITAPMGR
jgi:hypothetical protein